MPAEAGTDAAAEPREDRAGAYAWYVLAVLVVVYVFNYIDRQLLTILAPDLKRDLGISDSDFGFLYGTAFGLFYALFGIPLGKLADRWTRVRLLAIGLSLWSVMTALSGLSRNFGHIAAARIGVGIGEATAAPCAYSLIGDYFPPHRRATALGIYSTGLFIGGGVSLLVGSALAGWWNARFPGGSAPLGLVGWQAAFIMVGLAGVPVALWVATLREPRRGRFEEAARGTAGEDCGIGRAFLRELGDVVPPFTFFGAARRGGKALAINLLVALCAGLAAAGLIAWAGDPPQWIAIAIGAYAMFSWGAALRQGDCDAFSLLFRSRAFVGVSLGYSLISFIGYANIAFNPLYAIQELGAPQAQAGLVIGALSALGGATGVLTGGMTTDRLARGGDHSRRIAFVIGAALLGFAGHATMFSTHSLAVFYPALLATQFFASAALAAASGTMINIVPGRLVGTATAAFLMATNMIGLAMGPYTGGKLSVLLGDLGLGMLALLAVVPLIVGLLAMAYRDLSPRRDRA